MRQRRHSEPKVPSPVLYAAYRGGRLSLKDLSQAWQVTWADRRSTQEATFRANCLRNPHRAAAPPDAGMDT